MKSTNEMCDCSHPAVGRFIHIALYFSRISYKVIHPSILQCRGIWSGEDSLHSTHTHIMQMGKREKRCLA